jgi:hypothetical protein
MRNNNNNIVVIATNLRFLCLPSRSDARAIKSRAESSREPTKAAEEADEAAAEAEEAEEDDDIFWTDLFRKIYIFLYIYWNF